MWSPMQASRFHGSPYIYNSEEDLASIFHTVREDQTLTSIANQYETSVEDIASMNRIDNMDIVQASQILVVPVQRKILKRVTEITMDLTEVSAIYEATDESGQALRLLQKALKILDDAPGQQSTNAGIETQIGVIYFILGKYGESHATFKNAVPKLRASVLSRLISRGGATLDECD